MSVSSGVPSIFSRSRREYIRLGFSPIPRFAVSGAGSGRGWPRAWSDYCWGVAPEPLLRKWDRVPGAGIALCTGFGGLVAADLDSDDQGCRDALLGVLGHCRVARFGSKGLALLMRHESGAGIKSFNILQASGAAGSVGATSVLLEFKSLGANITVPPTVHAKTGNTYNWFDVFSGEVIDIWPAFDDLPVITDKQIAEVREAFSPWTPPPRFLKSRSGEKSEVEASDERLRAWAAAALAGIVNDLSAMVNGRNNALNNSAYKIAWAVRLGFLSEAEVHDALVGACRNNGLVGDDGLSGVERTFDSGFYAGLDNCEVPKLSDRRRPLGGGSGGGKSPPAEPPFDNDGNGNNDDDGFGGDSDGGGNGGGDGFKPRVIQGGKGKGGGAKPKEKPLPAPDPDFQIDKDGVRVKSYGNFKTALRLMNVKLRHNLFAGADEFIGFRHYDGPMTDRGADQLWLAIFETYKIKYAKEDFPIYMAGVADMDRYHPVKDYFDSLVWDNVPRLGKMLFTYWGANDSVANDFIGRAFMVAAVRRACFAPVKFDNILVLEGEQGKLKSTSLKMLCPVNSWFTDSFALKKSDPRDVIYQTRGKLIVEIAELTGIKNPEKIEHIKNLLSRDVDHTDLKWERRANDHPRQFVFAATTNYDTYLQDERNRRFWPVECGRIDVAAIERDRDRLWAEAVVLEANGMKIYPEGEQLIDELSALQEGRKIVDAWDDKIHFWLENGYQKLSQLSLSKVWGDCFEAPLERFKEMEQKRVAASLKRAGWERYTSNGKKLWKKSGKVPIGSPKSSPESDRGATEEDVF